MSLWLIILLSVIAVIVLGVLAWRLYDKVDDYVDEKQRAINTLENAFSEAGATWMSKLLADIVVGDEEEFVRKVKTLVDSVNDPRFFLEKVAVPCAVFAIRGTAGSKYPDLWAKIEDAYVKENVAK
jgi:hypothetical protein